MEDGPLHCTSRAGSQPTDENVSNDCTGAIAQGLHAQSFSTLTPPSIAWTNSARMLVLSTVFRRV